MKNNVWRSQIRSVFTSLGLRSFLVNFKPIKLQAHGVRNFATVNKLRQIQNQSNSEMTDLDKRIADLKAEIQGYVSKLNDVTNENVVAIYAGLINTARETLNKLLDQKKAFLHVAEQSKDHPRKERWDKLNEVISALPDFKEAKRGDHKGIMSCPCSSIRWENVRHAFGQPRKLIIASTEDKLSETYVTLLFNLYQLMNRTLGGLFDAKEAKTFLFIAPIFICVVGHFADKNQDVELLIEENVDGKRVKVNGHFEIVIRRGNKRICIVQAKKDDVEQGVAQDLLGLEVLADIHDLETVIGVVTNFKQWIFLKSCIDHVEKLEWNLTLNADIPTREALSQVTTYLISLLSDDLEIQSVL